MDQLASLLGLTPTVIAERLRVIGLTRVERDRLRSTASAAEANADQFIEDLYARLTRTPQTASWFNRPDTIDRLKSQQRAYLRELFNAAIDWDYVKRRLQIGVAHHRVRLRPPWYVATCAHFICDHIEVLVKSAPSDSEGLERIIALTKTILFDTALVLDAYGMSLEHSMRAGISNPGFDPGSGPGSRERTQMENPARETGRPPLIRLPLSTDDCEERARFIGIDDQTTRTLRELEPILRQVLPETLNEFYAVFRTWPETSSILPEEVVQRLLQQVASYWIELTQARFDRPYAASRTRIGVVHEQLGVSPQVYLIGLTRQLTSLLRGMAKVHPRPFLAASSLIRAVLYDVSFVMESYLDARAATVLRTEGYASTLLACLTVGVAVVDHDFRVRSVNPALLRLLGIEAALARHMNADDLIPGAPIRDLLEKVRGEQGRRESAQASFSGRLLRIPAVQLESSGSPSTPPPLALVIDDLTDLAQLAPRIDESETRLNETVAAVDAVVWEADPESWVMSLVSSPIIRLTGLRDVHFLGRPGAWLDRIPEPDRSRLVEECAALGRDRRCAVIHRILHADGTTRWVRTHVVRSGLTANETLLRGISLDVSTSFLEEKRRLEAVARLAGSVAHEFNGLLTVVSGSLGLLSETANDNDRIEIQAASNSVRRGAALSRQLQSFAQGVPLRLRPAQINELISSLEGPLRETAGLGIEVKLATEPDIWPCRIDTAQFSEAILNLVVNARDAMRQNGGRITIETRNVSAREIAPTPGVAEFADHVEVAIADTGPGMETETRQRAIEPFFTTKPNAAGLGLSVVHRFVNQSHGHLLIESGLNRGTTIRLRFPRFVTPAPHSSPTTHAQPSRRIVLVEDDTAVAAVIQRMLTRRGYVVQTLPTTEGAADLLAASPPDLVICDVMFAGQPRGAHLGRELEQRVPGLPVVYISGYSKDALNLGPETRFLAKPFSFEELDACLAQVFAPGNRPSTTPHPSSHQTFRAE